MKKKGFTLIELLAVMVLLGLIAIVATPVVREMIINSKEKLYREQVNLIEDGLKHWASANIFMLPEENGTIKISLGQLKQAGFIELDSYNPTNDECFSNESILAITRYNNSYIYKAEELIDVDCDLIKDGPTIKLNGDVAMYLSVGDIYTELGATAKDNNGNNITNSIVTLVTGSGNNINTTTPGNYTITYSVENNGKTTSIIRNVFVK